MTMFDATADTDRRALTQRALTQPLRRRAWSVGDDGVLRAHYAVDGPAFCAATLGRTLTQTYSRARKLGLFAPGNQRGRPRKIWHSDDHIDAAIRRAWTQPRKGMAAALARQLMRPKWWICKRALALGLTQPRLKEPSWSIAEHALLLSLARLTPTVIARRLRKEGYARTPTAIMVRLKRFDVSRRQAKTDADIYSASGLARLLGVDSRTVGIWIAREGLPAKRRGTARTEQQGGDEWEIHRRPLRRWIAGHAQLIDLRKVDRYWFFDLVFGCQSA